MKSSGSSVKRVFSFALALVLVFCMSFGALAAGATEDGSTTTQSEVTVNITYYSNITFSGTTVTKSGPYSGSTVVSVDTGSTVQEAVEAALVSKSWSGNISTISGVTSTRLDQYGNTINAVNGWKTVADYYEPGVTHQALDSVMINGTVYQTETYNTDTNWIGTGWTYDGYNVSVDEDGEYTYDEFDVYSYMDSNYINSDTAVVNIYFDSYVY